MHLLSLWTTNLIELEILRFLGQPLYEVYWRWFPLLLRYYFIITLVMSVSDILHLVQVCYLSTQLVISTSMHVHHLCFFRYKNIRLEPGWMGHFSLWASPKIMLPCSLHLGVRFRLANYHVPSSLSLTWLSSLHSASLVKLFSLMISSKTSRIWVVGCEWIFIVNIHTQWGLVRSFWFKTFATISI